MIIPSPDAWYPLGQTVQPRDETYAGRKITMNPVYEALAPSYQSWMSYPLEYLIMRTGNKNTLVEILMADELIIGTTSCGDRLLHAGHLTPH